MAKAKAKKPIEKIRINICLDDDVIAEAQRIADVRYGKEQGRGKRQGYQTILNEKLRESLLSGVGHDTLEARINRLENALKTSR